MEQGGITKTFDPIFENVEKLTKGQRVAICVISLIVLIGGFAYFLILPKYKTINILKGEHQKLTKKLVKAKKNAADLNKFRAEMKKAEAKFKQVMQSLPEKEEIPSLLAGISQSGKDTGLYFLLFKPMAEKKKDFYAEIPVSIEVLGSYHNFARFFDKVARLPRIVNIRDIVVEVPGLKKGAGIGAEEGSGVQPLKAKCKAVTYKFIEKPETDKPKKK